MSKRTLIIIPIALLALALLSGVAGAAPAGEATPNAPAATVAAPPAAPTNTPAVVPPISPSVIELKSSEPVKAEKPAIRIGYVDLVKVGSESLQGVAIKGQIKAKSDSWQGKINSRKKQIEKLQKSIQEQLPTLNQQQRGGKAKEFEKKVEDYQKFVQKAEKEMQGLQEELTIKLYQQIEQAAQSYGKGNGYTAIVVKKDMLYLASGVETQDVTAEVLKLVNESAKK